MKILVTGASGMLGKDIVKTFTDGGHEVTETDREQLDITNAEQVNTFVAQEKPEVIINCAAYNFVDKVEEEEFYPIAYAVNATGPKNLAQAAKNSGARFVHYSTDYVFAGDKPEGYKEDDVTGPISKYGETKLAGETNVQEVGGDYLICRLSKIFGAPGLSEGTKESFVALMLRLAAKMPELSIVDEEVGSPSYTLDIAQETLNLIEENVASGVYHLVNAGEGVTWYAFAKEIFNLAGVETPFKPVTSAEFPKPAARPKFAALLNTKRPPMRSRTEALAAFLHI
jgi:dTDP-4-dehydrorhamnose reductase